MEPPPEFRNSSPAPPETTACMPLATLRAPWLSNRLPGPSRCRRPVCPQQPLTSKLTLTLPSLTTLPVSWRSPRQQPVVLMAPVLVSVCGEVMVSWAVPPQASPMLLRSMAPALVESPYRVRNALTAPQPVMSRLRWAPAAMARLPATALEPAMCTVLLPVGKQAPVEVVGIPADQLPAVNQLLSAAAPVHDVSHVAARTGVRLVVTDRATEAMATANRVSKRIMRLLLRRHRRLQRPARVAGRRG